MVSIFEAKLHNFVEFLHTKIKPTGNWASVISHYLLTFLGHTFNKSQELISRFTMVLGPQNSGSSLSSIPLPRPHEV